MAETAAILTDESMIEVISITTNEDGDPVNNNLPIRVTLADLKAYFAAEEGGGA